EMMRPHASLHADQARGHVGEPGFDLATRPLLSQHDGPTSIQANNMERVLPDIDADYGNSCLACLSHGVLLFICAPASLIADGAGARPDHPISGPRSDSRTGYRPILPTECGISQRVEIVVLLGQVSISATIWPSATTSPSATRISATRPATGA